VFIAHLQKFCAKVHLFLHIRKFFVQFFVFRLFIFYFLTFAIDFSTCGWSGFANRMVLDWRSSPITVSVLETLCFGGRNTLFLRLKQSVSLAKIF